VEADEPLNPAPLHSFCVICSCVEFLNLGEQNLSQKYWLVCWVWGRGTTRQAPHCWCQGHGRHDQQRVLPSPFHLPSYRRWAPPSVPGENRRSRSKGEMVFPHNPIIRAITYSKIRGNIELTSGLRTFYFPIPQLDHLKKSYKSPHPWTSSLCSQEQVCG